MLKKSLLTIDLLIKSMGDKMIGGNILSKDKKALVFKLIKETQLCHPDINLHINSDLQHSFLHLSLILQYHNSCPVQSLLVKLNSKVIENILHKRPI